MAKGSNHNMGRSLDQAMKDKLSRGIAKIEKLQDEQDEIGEDIKAVKRSLKDIGFNTMAVNRILSDNKRRAKDPEKFEDFSTALDIYMVALGYD